MGGEGVIAMTQLKNMVVSVRLSPGLINEVDELMSRAGKDTEMFPKGPPSRAEFLRVLVVYGMRHLKVCLSRRRHGLEEEY